MRRYVVAWTQVVFIAALCSSAQAANFIMDSTTDAGVRSLVIQGHYAYLSLPTGLQIMDVSNPGAPVFVSRLDLPVPRNPATFCRFSIALKGTVAYVPMDADGLYVIDVSNPDSPAVLAHAPTPRDTRVLAVAGDYLYAGTSDTGIITYSLANPGAPVRLGITPDRFLTSHDMAVHNGHLYLASEDLFVYSLADPAHPVAVDTVLEPSRCVAVEAVGDYLYLADFWLPQQSPHVGFETLEASDPAHPVLVYSERLHAGDYDVLVDFPVAYVLNPEVFNLHVFNVSDASAPVALPASPPVWADAQSMTKHGGYLYTSGINRVWAIEMSLRGECTGNSVITSADIIALVNYVFKGGPAPVPSIQGDTNCVGGTTAADVIRLVDYVFKGGGTPACL